MAQNTQEYKEIFIPFMWDREHREYAVKDINGEAKMSFSFPVIAERLLDLRVVFIAHFNGYADFTIESEYGKDGEPSSQNYQFGDFNGVPVRNNWINELSIKSMYINIEKGHNCGMYFVSMLGPVYGLGLKIIYD